MPPVLVEHLMTSPVLSLREDQTVAVASDVMTYRSVRHLPIIDEQQRVAGMISQRDVLAARDREAAVGTIMTRGVLTVRADVLASIAAGALLDHKFGCLPVVDEEGRLVGIVTQHDFLRLAAAVLEAADPGDQPVLSTLTVSSCSTREVSR